MPKIFRPSTREASILSKIESSKIFEKRKAISKIKDHIDSLSNAISMKLLEHNIVETNNKNSIEIQIKKCLDKLVSAKDFDIDYQVAPFRNIVHHPHVVSVYVTAFVIEKLINHKDVIDIFGSDEDIYRCINGQVSKVL